MSDTLALALTVRHWTGEESNVLALSSPGPGVSWNLAGDHNTYDSVKVDDDAPAGLLILIMMLMEMMLLLMMIMVILGRPSWSRRLKLGLEAIKQVPLGCRPLSITSFISGTFDSELEHWNWNV